MDNITLNIGDKKIPLRFRMNQFAELEEAIGNLGEIRDRILTDKTRIKNIVFVVRVLGSAGLKHAGEDNSWLTEDWLMENMEPHAIMAYQIAILACLEKENESQAVKEENENKERDLVLEEINAKKDPVNSHTGE